MYADVTFVFFGVCACVCVCVCVCACFFYFCIFTFSHVSDIIGIEKRSEKQTNEMH